MGKTKVPSKDVKDKIVDLHKSERGYKSISKGLGEKVTTIALLLKNRGHTKWPSTVLGLASGREYDDEEGEDAALNQAKLGNGLKVTGTLVTKKTVVQCTLID